MNLAMFGIFGYISFLLWLLSLVLLWLHFRRRPRRWLCHYTLVVALVALVFAELNSRTYVNRLQVDQSEAIAAAHARQAEARRMAESERAGDVAQIRFAEDASKDFLDMAGLDEADRKYIESMDETLTPAWKQERRQRSAGRAADHSLEGQLDTTEQAGGLDSGNLEKLGPKVVVLPNQVVQRANQLDGLHLKLLRVSLLVGLGLVLLDYLQRANRVDEAYFPLPLPSALVDSMATLPAVYSVSTERARHSHLLWLVRRGDTFLYLTGHVAVGSAIPSSLPRWPRGVYPFDVLHVSKDDALIEDAFIFDGLWYNRAAFVVDSLDRAEPLLMHFYEYLVQRKRTRAHVRQTVHVVWDLDIPLKDALDEGVIRLFGAAGICFCQCEGEL